MAGSITTITSPLSRLAATIIAAVLLLGPREARAQRRGGDGFLFQPPTVSFGLRAGYDRAFAGSDLFDFTTQNLTVSRSSFSSASWAGDMAVRLTPRTDLVFGVAFSGSRAGSEFRNWVDNQNQPIRQRTTFKRIPLTASYRMYLLPRGVSVGRFAWVPARYAPYVGGGVGVVYYQFRQAGDFIDFSTLKVFPDVYNTSGWARAVHLLAGTDVAVASHVALTGEARYTWAKATPGPDFTGFNRIDLSGLSVTAGVSMRL